VDVNSIKLKNISRQFPLVLLVNVGWRQDKTLENGEGKVMGSGMFEYATKGRN